MYTLGRLTFLCAALIVCGCQAHPALISADDKTSEIRAYILQRHANALSEIDRAMLLDKPSLLQAYVLSGDFMDARWRWPISGDRFIQAQYFGKMNNPIDSNRIAIHIGDMQNKNIYEDRILTLQ